MLMTGCGFTPLHGTHFKSEAQKKQSIAIQEELAQVWIGAIPNREGQFLRNALIDRFYQKSYPTNAHYRLSISPISTRTVSLGVTKDDDTTRGQMILSTKITLHSPLQPDSLLTRDLKSITSYNKLGSEFGTIVSEDNARENGLNEIADQIERELSLYFSRLNTDLMQTR